jgi:hypothetical protein
VIDKKKAITNGKTLDALVRLRDKECAIGKLYSISDINK